MNSEKKIEGRRRKSDHALKSSQYQEKKKKRWLYDKRKETVLSKIVFFTFSELLHFGRQRGDLLVRVNISLHNLNSHALLTYRVVDKSYTTIIIKTLYTTRDDS